MKTDELIQMLSTRAGPADLQLPRRLVARTILFTLLAATLLSITLMGGASIENMLQSAFWLKVAYAGLLAALASHLFVNAGKPAVPLTQNIKRLASLVLLAIGLGLAYCLAAPLGERLTLITGHSWLACPWLIALVSAPGLAASLISMRAMAPTQPRIAGFACGIFAGAVSSAGYAIACTESSPTFVALWYSAGILLVGVIGALLGPRVLRW